MDLSKLNEHDLAVLEKQYPSAYSFLQRRALWNEYWLLLKSHIPLNDWQQNRLRELQSWVDSIEK